MKASEQSISGTKAIEILAQCRADGVDAEFQCGGHWGIGCNKHGFWYSYYCCDACEQWDYEDFETADGLMKSIKNLDSAWFRTK